MSEQPLDTESSFKEDEPGVTKLVQSSELDSPNIEPWMLSNFENDDESSSEDISDKVYAEMQKELQPRLQQQAELLKQEAYDKAFQQGYEEGLAKGKEEGSRQGESEAKAEVMKTLEPKLEQFDSILGALQKPFESLEQKLYSELVEFALHVAQTVIKKSVLEQKDWVLHAVQEAVVQLPESSNVINVYLHPDDLAFIQISKPSISENWQLHENMNVEKGTCLVKQDYSTILNSWIARFDDVVQHVSQDVSEESDQEPSLDK